MSYQVFKESEIHSALCNKVVNGELRKKGPHFIAKIYIEGKYITRIKFPNPHKKDFGQGKAKNLAAQLQLNQEQYNNLIKCPLKRDEYFKILRKANNIPAAAKRKK